MGDTPSQFPGYPGYPSRGGRGGSSGGGRRRDREKDEITDGVSDDASQLADMLTDLTKRKEGQIMEYSKSVRDILNRFGLGGRFAKILRMLGFLGVGDIGEDGLMSDWIVPGEFLMNEEIMALLSGLSDIEYLALSQLLGTFVGVEVPLLETESGGVDRLGNPTPDPVPFDPMTPLPTLPIPYPEE